MKLISVSVGMPQIVQTSEEGFITTAIFKQSVAGKVKVGQLNLEGDAQADLRVHGGWSKAVYAYPVEHYDYWRTEFPEKKLEDAQFGENLAIQGLLETELCIGDRLRRIGRIHRHGAQNAVQQIGHSIWPERHHPPLPAKPAQRVLSRRYTDWRA